MVREKFSMQNKVLSYFTEIVHEEAIPVNVEIGHRYVDKNGDTQADVLLEYKEQDKECINEVITRAVNAVINEMSFYGN